MTRNKQQGKIVSFVTRLYEGRGTRPSRLLECIYHVAHPITHLCGTHPLPAEAHLPALHVFLANNQYLAVSARACLSDLGTQRPCRGIHIHGQAGRIDHIIARRSRTFNPNKDVADLFSPTQYRLRRVDREDDGLPWVQPERPFPIVGLDKKRHQSLHGSEDCAVYHHRPHRAIFGKQFRVLGRLASRFVFWSRGLILELESLRQLEVKLDCRRLMFLSIRVLQDDVDLWPVERPVSFIDAPFHA
ncbi:Uncharacterized protein TCAP_01788 [Tolypocladium capitatum]|uniref:Uncharacterized protein n=1 Tax=Tolypocladium capitatum TaxID=45235 RepID=A0A2K3QL70_9HYPO|nr:Uncharacterized protein TCAP_01788 [Tolypocladium capitatum]